MITTEESLVDLLKRFEDIGLDELVFVPRVPDLDLVDRIAQVVG